MLNSIAAASMLIALARGIAQDPPAAPSQDRTVVSRCTVAGDTNYGFSVENPIQVGGGATNGPARERRYLQSLRGPAGEMLTSTRKGSAHAPDKITLLDVYEVTYPGLEKPWTLYVDEYHFSEPSAPHGLVCGQPIGLGLPPADPFLTSAALVAVAIEQGETRDFTPIPLGADGATTRGIVFDQFRLVARAARAAAAARTKLDPAKLPPEVARAGTIVLAYPVMCEGRGIAPVSIDIIGSQGAAVPRDGDYARDAALGVRLPGVQTPAASLAASFRLANLRPNDTVRIGYAEPMCGGASIEAVLPVRHTDPRTISASTPPLPPGVAPSDLPVRLQTLVDLDGMLHRSSYLGGPIHLTQLAIDTVAGWRGEPRRINGAPVATGVIVQVKFKP